MSLCSNRSITLSKHKIKRNIPQFQQTKLVILLIIKRDDFQEFSLTKQSRLELRKEILNHIYITPGANKNTLSEPVNRLKNYTKFQTNWHWEILPFIVLPELPGNAYLVFQFFRLCVIAILCGLLWKEQYFTDCFLSLHTSLCFDNPL